METRNEEEVISRLVVESKDIETVFKHELYWRVDWHKSLPYLVFICQKPFKPSGKDKEKTVFEKLEDQHTYKNTFNEQLAEYHSPEIYLYNYESKTLFNLEDPLSELDPTIAVFCQEAQALDLFLQGYKKEAFRRGYMFCFNRKSSIFRLNIALEKEGNETPVESPSSIKKLAVCKKTNLTPDFFSSHSPFLAPSNETLYFCSQPQKFVEHNSSYHLYSLNLKTQKISELIGTVRKPSSTFVGLNQNIFLHSQRHFLHNGKFLLFTSQVENSCEVFLLDLRIVIRNEASNKSESKTQISKRVHWFALQLERLPI